MNSNYNSQGFELVRKLPDALLSFKWTTLYHWATDTPSTLKTDGINGCIYSPVHSCYGDTLQFLFLSLKYVQLVLLWSSMMLALLWCNSQHCSLYSSSSNPQGWHHRVRVASCDSRSSFTLPLLPYFTQGCFRSFFLPLIFSFPFRIIFF